MLTLNLANFYDVINGEMNKPVMVEFWAPWCGYCRKLSAAYDMVAEKYQEEMLIGKVNIDDAMELAEKYRVEIIPSILIFEKGKLVKRVVNPPDQAAIETFIQSDLPEAAMSETAMPEATIPEPQVNSGKNAAKSGEETAFSLTQEELEAVPDAPIYGYSLEKPNGELLKLADYKGHVLLIVNTATGCNFTPQYKQLEEIYAKYRNQGLEILDIPCNQFNGQAPGTDEEIHKFCTVKFGTTFPQLKKAEVNGPNALPLYAYLKSQKGFQGFGSSFKGIAMAAMLTIKDSDYKNNPDIKWNFTKFLVDRKGNVVACFEPTADMNDVAKAVAKLL